MKLVMTLLVRNEADVIDANIAFHLDAGVDFVIATDNKSDDGTTEILEKYEREGCLHLIREARSQVLQEYWVTDMARLAWEQGADWVINADADEFWWSRLGPLREVLARIPSRYDTVRAFLRNFVPRPDGGESFDERMTGRLVPWQLPPDSPFQRHPFHPQDKVVHRGHPAVTISGGNHEARWEGSVDLRGWWPLEVLHFPIRSVVQSENKRSNWERHNFGPLKELVVGTAGEYYDSLVVTGDEQARGIADGWLTEDTRIRDRLRGLRPFAGSGRSVLRDLPDQRADSGSFEAPSPIEEACFAADVSAGESFDTVVRMRDRLEELDVRLGLLESASLRSLRGRALGAVRASLGSRRR